MKEQIEVTICTGTACYVMGGCNFLQINDNPPTELKERINVKGTTCLGICREKEMEMKPPFVKINKAIYSPTDYNDFVRLIKLEVEKNENTK